jgi:hypothetical protein
MSGLSTAGMMKDWGAVMSVPDASPSGLTDLPGCTLRQPWQRPQASSAEPAARLDPAAADFGIRFARGFVAARRRGLVPRRRGRVLLRQLPQRRGAFALKWIRHAIRYLERTEGRPAAGWGRLSPPQRAVAEAIAIHRAPRRRALLRRLLLSQGADPDPLAWVLGLDAGTVAAYRALFLDVGDRAGEPLRFFAALKLADKEDSKGRDAGDSGLPPLVECACLGFGMAAAHCGLVIDGRGPAAGSLALAGHAGNAAEVTGFVLAWRSLLLHPGTCAPGAKVAGDAIRKYHKVREELRAQPPVAGMAEAFGKAVGPLASPEPEESEPEIEIEPVEATPEPWPASARLTLEDLRWMAGLWHDCAPAVSALPLPLPLPASSLLPPWHRAEESKGWEGSDGSETAASGFPDEMARPDFGRLLAERVAAAGRSGELPAGGAFHWIRLMAARLETELPVAERDVGDTRDTEDAEDAALRRAVELHAGEASRQLLQAALVTRDAEIGEVAKWLGLDARVVDAYVTLFFNPSVRRGPASDHRAIACRIQSGRDSPDGGSTSAGHGLAEVMEAAPGITLDDFRRLLGFHAVDSSEVNAADRLLELLCRVPRGGPNQDAARNQKRRIEIAVRLAAERVNASGLGLASALANISSVPDLKRAQQKASKQSDYDMRVRTLMTVKGLTREEAELMYEQQKRKNP